MACRHNLATRTCARCYPATGTVEPSGRPYAKNPDSPGAVPMMKVYRVTHDGDYFISNEIDKLWNEIGDPAVGSKYTVTVEEMDGEDFENLPEFDGF